MYLNPVHYWKKFICKEFIISLLWSLVRLWNSVNVQFSIYCSFRHGLAWHRMAVVLLYFLTLCTLNITVFLWYSFVLANYPELWINGRLLQVLYTVKPKLGRKDSTVLVDVLCIMQCVLWFVGLIIGTKILNKSWSK